MQESPERSIAIAGAVCGTLTGAALIVGFYAAFQQDRLTFWIWFVACAVLLPADILLSRFTGVSSMARMTNLYVSFGVRYPRSRARTVVTLARFVTPLFVLAFLYSQVWGAIVSTSLGHPVVPIAVLFAAACGGLAYFSAFVRSTR